MTQHDTHLTPIAELRANVAVPFEAARAMPKSVYTSPEFLAQELEHIFRADWLCAGRADALPNPGDYLTMDIAGEPIIILRDRDGVLRGLSNVCRHRMSTLLQGRGNVRSIVCPYHAWTYNLDGTLRGAPAMTPERRFLQGSGQPAADPRGKLAGLDHGHPEPRCPAACGKAVCRQRSGRLSGYVELYRNLPRDVQLGHQLEGAGREFHGKLPPAGLPFGHHRRVGRSQPDDLPRGD